ncbi:MAG: hypothetical protein K2L11_01110, partial [Muribaculaceae bacterium]|nr:hypothetical protein [Muribaculaceae bacterium]
MKAKFLALLLFLFLLNPMGMSADSRRIWDFTKGLSARTVENLNADEEHWTTDRTDSNGVTDRWKIVGEFSYTEPLKADGEIIAETDNLLFAIAGQPTNSILISQDNLRLGRPNSTITFPHLRNGQTVTIVGQSPNKTADSRGISPVQDYLKYVGDENALVDGQCIFLGRELPGSQDVYMFSWQVQTDEDGEVDVQFQIGPEGGIDFMMFAIDITPSEKDNIMARG